MYITRVSIKKKPDDDPAKKVLVYADVVIYDEFCIHGVKIVGHDDGTTHVAFPARKDFHSDKYTDVCHPITSEARETICSAVLEAYDEYLEKGPSYTKKY